MTELIIVVVVLWIGGGCAAVANFDWFEEISPSVEAAAVLFGLCLVLMPVVVIGALGWGVWVIGTAAYTGCKDWFEELRPAKKVELPKAQTKPTKRVASASKTTPSTAKAST